MYRRSGNENNKKIIIKFLIIIFIIMNLTACGYDENHINGTYLSYDKKTMFVGDKEIIFIIQGDDIGASNYSIDGNKLTIGENKYNFNGKERKSLKIGSEIYTKISCPLSVRWKLVKWSSKLRIESASLGIIQWMILDPIFMTSINSAGFYSMIGSWIALIGVVIFICIIALIYYFVKEMKNNK